MTLVCLQCFVSLLEVELISHKRRDREMLMINVSPQCQFIIMFWLPLILCERETYLMAPLETSNLAWASASVVGCSPLWQMGPCGREWSSWVRRTVLPVMGERVCSRHYVTWKGRQCWGMMSWTSVFIGPAQSHRVGPLGIQLVLLSLFGCCVLGFYYKGLGIFNLLSSLGACVVVKLFNLTFNVAVILPI